MNNLISLKIAWRILWRLVASTCFGSVFFGTACGYALGIGFPVGETLLLIKIGLGIGAVWGLLLGCLTLRHFSIWSWWEAVQNALRGALIGALIGGFGAALTGIVAAVVFKDPLLIQIFACCGAILGAFAGSAYLILHPKYAPREETVIVFSDDYMKDGKIEWK